jgi:hypothetical protein
MQIKSVVSLFVLLVLGALAFPSLAAAQSDTNPLDWSEYEQKLWDWPFQETGYRIERQGFDVFQITTVRESPEAVYQKLSEMRQQKIKIHPDYSFVGEVYSPLDNSYQVSFMKENLQFLLRIKSDPAGGTELRIQTTPMPHVSGYFKLALYEYRLGNNERVTIYRTDGQSY